MRTGSALQLSMLCLVIGCGPNHPATVPVHGTVTWDGEPVGAAAVMFIPESGGRPATGTTSDDGRFELATFHPGDGAILGDHTVTVVKKEITGDAYIDDRGELVTTREPSHRWIIPERYSRKSSSGIRITVKHGMEPARINLN